MLAPSQSRIVQAWRRIPVTLRERRSRFATFWREGHRQARIDLSHTWKRDGTYFIAFVWFSGLCAGLGLLCALNIFASLNSLSGTACQPDGSFQLEPEKFRFWKSGFFQISLGFGALSFTQAKTVDIIWDVIFGRGGQGLLAFISWRVFAIYITNLIEVSSITFNTYRAVFLQREPSIIGIPRLIRDFTLRLSIHSKTAMVFIIVTMTYILAFPTLGSAMTGYSGNVKSFVSDYNGNLIPFESFHLLSYVIHDGWRINQTADFTVPANYSNYFGDPILSNFVDMSELYGSDMQRNVSYYVGQHGFYGRENESSVFMNITLPAPVLNVSAFYLTSDFNGTIWMDPFTQERPFANTSQLTWTYSNQTYDLHYISTHGSCQTVAEYKWGFSFIQLSLMIIFLMLWTIGIFIMWIQSCHTMRQRGRKEVAGEHKAIFELAEAMRTQLVRLGIDDVDDPPALRESDLRSRITKDLRGGSISYNNSVPPMRNTKGKKFTEWGCSLKIKKEELWEWARMRQSWLTAFLISLVVCIAVGYFLLPFFRLFIISLPLSFPFTLYCGSTNSSRGILFLWSILLLSVLLIPFWL